jgi:hypothetical protein
MDRMLRAARCPAQTVTLLLGGGVASFVRMLEQRYRLTAVTLLLLAAIVWFVRSI